MAAPANSEFLTKIVAAASQGAVGAFVGAGLSAVTEPVVNKVLVERKTLTAALQEHDFAKIVKFFETTVATNFVKFPFFEVVNVIVNSVDIPAEVRGTITGIIFTSATLPITNYRFRKSMNLPMGGFGELYQAYLPTVLRDIVYGIARNKVMGILLAKDPKIMGTPKGRFIVMFCTVLSSCVLSAPGNELRGYCLQPPSRKKPFNEFFDPVKTIRSTTIGGLIMSTSLATGAFCTPFVEAFVARIKEPLRKDPVGGVLVLIVLLNTLLTRSKLAKIESKLEAK